MKKLALCGLIAVCLLPFGGAAAQDVSGDASCAQHPCLTTYHNNNSRTGVNPFETVLVANSFPSGFGATPTYVQVDGMVYAQPLYVYGVAWAGSTGCSAATRNMVYVATELNTIYAIDADTYATCKQLSLNATGTNADTAIPVTALPQVGTPTPAPCNNLSGSSQYGTVGITGTPAIDPNHNTLFVVSAHQSVATPYTYTQRLNAVDITTLSIIGTPLDIPTNVNAAKPSGYPTFYALNQSQRSGLTLGKIGSSGMNIFVPWGTFCDGNVSSGGSFGLVSEFDWNYTTSAFDSAVESFYMQGANTNLSFNPSGNPAGVWMSGGAPAMDTGGNVYVVVGNGHFEGITAPLNFGNSIVKLGGSSFAEEDFYTPNIWSLLNSGSSHAVSCSPYPNNATCQITSLPQGDWDMGSGGVVLLTASSGTTYGELVAGGKEGMFYVTYYCSGSSSTQCPTTNWNQVMGGLDGPSALSQGGYNTNSHADPTRYSCTPVATAMTPSPGNIAQCIYGVPVQATRAESGERSTPAYWSPGGTATPYLYTIGTTDVPKAYSFSSSTGTFNTSPTSGSTTYYYPGATPSVSWDGSHTNTAVLWALETSAWNSTSGNQAVLTAYNAVTLAQLWTSTTPGGPGAVKFTVPTVANGKVYVGGQVSGTGLTHVQGCQSANGCGGLLAIYH